MLHVKSSSSIFDSTASFASATETSGEAALATSSSTASIIESVMSMISWSLSSGRGLTTNLYFKVSPKPMTSPSCKTFLSFERRTSFINVPLEL